MTVDLTKPNDADSISIEELELYHAIIAYRAGLGLAPLPLSKALSATAGRHVVDWRENIWGEGKTIVSAEDAHSWSDAPYAGENGSARAMYDAPERLGTGYESSGYEIAAFGGRGAEPVLDAWIDSPSHNAILSNTGVWAGYELNAIGVGIDTTPGPGPYGGLAHSVWFGQALDPETPEIRGSDDADVIAGTDFDDLIYSGQGDDEVYGGGGDDELRAGAGSDRVSGNAGSDLIYGNGDRDRLYGGGGGDKLIGGSDDDRLFGGGGVDHLHGGSGQDTLIGGDDADVLTGGGDADVFLYRSLDDSRPGAADTIADFEVGLDLIDLTAIDANALTEADDAFDFIGRSQFDRTPGQLRREDHVIEADTDGDGTADLRIELSSYTTVADAGSDDGLTDASGPVEVTVSPYLYASDFVL